MYSNVLILVRLMHSIKCEANWGIFDTHTGFCDSVSVSLGSAPVSLLKMSAMLAI